MEKVKKVEKVRTKEEERRQKEGVEMKVWRVQVDTLTEMMINKRKQRREESKTPFIVEQANT
jgi:hypothetical protein